LIGGLGKNKEGDKIIENALNVVEKIDLLSNEITYEKTINKPRFSGECISY
jgi:hypothetical protein